MKRIKKIGVALILIVAVLSIGIFAALGANDMFTGTVYRLGIYVNDMEKIVADVNDGKNGAIDELDALLIEIDTYLFESPVNPESEGFEELDAKIKAAKVLVTNKSLENVAALDDPLEKSAYLKLAGYWFENTPYTDEEIEGDAYKSTKNLIATTSINVATSLYEDITAANFDSTVEKEIAAEGVKLKRLRTFLTENSIAEDSEFYVSYIEVYNRYLDLWMLYTDKMSARYAALTERAPLSEYGLGNGMSPYTFENNQTAPSLANSTKTNSNGETRKVVSVTETETYLDASGLSVTNAYRTLRWPTEADVGINAYITPSYTGTSKGAVIEFDITTFGSFVNSKLDFGNRRADSDVAAMGGPTTATLCSISEDGDLMCYLTGSDTQTVVFEDVIAPGQWTRISFVVDPKYPTEAQVFVDYCYVATIDSRLSGSNPINLRIGNNTKITTGEFSIDNFTCQLGTWFRDENLINSITDPVKKLQFYVNYMANEENKTPDRIVAYNGVKDLIGQYATLDDASGKYTVLPAYATNEDVLGCIDTFNGFDSAAIIAEYKTSNLAKLVTMKSELDAIARDLTTYSKRQTKLDEINTFITNNSAYIEEGAAYNDILTAVGTVQAEIDMDKAIASFVTTMEGFAGTSSVTLLNAKYEEATTILAGLDVDLRNEVGYEKFADAYNAYLAAPDVISDQVTVKNARDIVTYINYLIELYPNEMDWKIYPIEGDQLTEAEEAHNAKYKFISEYMIKIRKLVKGGYSLKYVGIDGAIQRFEAMDAHYYDLLQAEYAVYYESVLDEFAASDSYIVKQGLIAHIERYKAENDIDVAHAAIALLETRYNAYKAELEYQIDSYADILRQNSVYFVNYVKLFDTAITYTEKKELYDNATEFYYLMNASGDGVEEAIATYDAMTAELALVEESSRAFMDAVELMGLTENADIYYSYLVDAMINYQLADSSIEGVAEATLEYNEALAAYEAKIGAANSEICEIGESLGSLRANCGLSAIISVIIEKLFSF